MQNLGKQAKNKKIIKKAKKKNQKKKYLPPPKKKPQQKTNNHVKCTKDARNMCILKPYLMHKNPFAKCSFAAF